MLSPIRQTMEGPYCSSSLLPPPPSPYGSQARSTSLLPPPPSPFHGSQMLSMSQQMPTSQMLSQELSSMSQMPSTQSQSSFIPSTALERANLYRSQVQANIEAAVVSLVKQVVRGDKPFLIQCKVARSANIPTTGTLIPESQTAEIAADVADFTQHGSFIANGGWSWRTKSNKQTLPKLPPGQQYIRFGHKRSRTKFCLQFHLMAKVYGMVIKSWSSTIRDLYYENVNLYRSQARLETVIYELCHVLKVPREGLRIEATSKGLMAGNLKFKTTNGDVINLDHFKSGMLIPSLSSLDAMCDIQSDANQIIVVEKDAVFQRLIDERIFEVLGPTILITGKGYPDLVTLRMIRKLRDALSLKVFAFVDCDPYGIEIAAVIRWGSYKQASIAKCANDWSIAEELTVPDLVWIGLLPSEIAELSLKFRASSILSLRDRYKIHMVKQRILANGDADWIHEIDILQNSDHKAELEALFIHPKFTNFYIQQKLGEYFKIVASPAIFRASSSAVVEEEDPISELLE